jgi:hypothetical protein
MARPHRIRGDASTQPDDVVHIAISQYLVGNWTVTECATYTGYHKRHMSRILNGERRKDVMAAVDPSSCAPVYRQSPRPTVCPACDRGRTWTHLTGVVDQLGRVTFRCSGCGMIV